MKLIKMLFIAAGLLALVTFPSGSSADHSWGNYHWARTSNPFTLKVVDSNTPNWDDNLDLAMSDWARSTVLDLVREAGDDSARTRKRCPMVSGKIRSCNADYGFNGWLGLASINVSGSHITQGTSKMNDSYLQSTRYNETNRQHVMCQEIGHDFGLGHQDESGADLNTCMDYANALDNPSPNTHDYQQLETIYAHLDSTTTVGVTTTKGNKNIPDGEEVTNDPSTWGTLVRQSANGRSSIYLRQHSNGTRTYTHVFWTEEAANRCRGCDHRYDH